MSAELKPCPLCKRPPHRNGRGNAGGVLCVGHTEDDGGNHRFQTYGANQAEADEAWNRASATATPGALDPATVERCAKIARVHGATLDLAHGHEDAEGQADRWYEGGKTAARNIADEIVALATDPHQHGGKGA